jgi:hypothetical protein
MQIEATDSHKSFHFCSDTSMRKSIIPLVATLLVFSACDDDPVTPDFDDQLFYANEIEGEDVPRVLSTSGECVTLLMPSNIALQSGNVFEGRIEQVLMTCEGEENHWTVTEISGTYQRSGSSITFNTAQMGALQGSFVNDDHISVEIDGTEYLFVRELLVN